MAADNGGADALAHVNKVVRSINAPGEMMCVDVFRRPDNSYGWALYRREPEDGHGWFLLSEDRRAFQSPDTALATAGLAHDWLTGT